MAAIKVQVDNEVKNHSGEVLEDTNNGREAMEVEESLGSIDMRECEELQGVGFVKGSDLSNEVAANPKGSL